MSGYKTFSLIMELFTTGQIRKATAFGKWYYNLSLYNRYGMYHDDLWNEYENPEVAEAVRRLPKDLYDQRVYRCIRQGQLEITKTYLPKEEWTKIDDPMHWYLEPYVNEVLAEWKEKSEWDKKHPQ